MEHSYISTIPLIVWKLFDPWLANQVMANSCKLNIRPPWVESCTARCARLKPSYFQRCMTERRSRTRNYLGQEHKREPMPPYLHIISTYCFEHTTRLIVSGTEIIFKQS